MRTNSRDESNQAEITRLQNAVTALGDRLASIEGPPEAPKIDAKALKAERAAHSKAVADLRQRLTELCAFSESIDDVMAQLVELIIGERGIRRDILTAHGELIEKEQRRELANDAAIVAAVKRHLDDTLRPTSDYQQPAFATLADQQRKVIIHRLENGEPIDELLA